MGNAISVITLPIKTEIWQADIIEKRFDLCRKVYNTLIGYERKKYRKLIKLPEYMAAKGVLSEYYKSSERDDDGNITNKKIPAEVKEAKKVINDLYKENGFSEYSFGKACTEFYQVFKQNISSMIANRSIATPAWVAFEKLLFKDGKDVHFKSFGTFDSVVSDCRSGIRLTDEYDKTMFTWNGGKLFVSYGTSKGKTLKMPVIIDPKDTYKQTMLTRSFRTVRILHKKVRGKMLYYVQIAVEGEPAVKLTKDGKRRHPIGNKKVGIYIDTTSITIATEDSCQTIKFNELHDYSEHDQQINEINRYLDTSKRISNPENFAENGTIKNGIIKDGVRHKLKWTYSKGYCKARDKKANLQRVDAENRKIGHEILANTIISYGTDITMNKFDFKQAQRRKSGNPTKADGSPASKAMAGETIKNNAPSMLVSILNRKLVSAGFSEVKRVKLEVDRNMKDYRSRYAKELQAM